MVPLVIWLLVMLTVVFFMGRLSVKRSPATSAFKCATCRNCGRIDPDGVMCRFGNKETFKNLTHIKYCMDFEDDSRIPAQNEGSCHKRQRAL